jgi:hypothetical protein
MLESGGMVSFSTLCSCKGQPPMPRLLQVHERKHQRLLVSSAGVSPASVEMGFVCSAGALARPSSAAPSKFELSFSGDRH